MEVLHPSAQYALYRVLTHLFVLVEGHFANDLAAFFLLNRLLGSNLTQIADADVGCTAASSRLIDALKAEPWTVITSLPGHLFDDDTACRGSPLLLRMNRLRLFLH